MVNFLVEDVDRAFRELAARGGAVHQGARGYPMGRTDRPVRRSRREHPPAHPDRLAKVLLRLRRVKTAELKGEGGVKAIGIVGSPRRGGSTDVLVEQVLAGARAHGLEAEKVYLGELDIRPCRACYSCAATGRCVIEDDFPWLLEKVLGSVGIVLGSPMYVGTVTALMKAFIDRVDCSQVEMVRAPTGEARFRRRHRGRWGVVVAVCDLSPLAELRHCVRVLGACLRDLGAEPVDEVLARRLADVGDVEKRPELIERAFRAGEELARAIKGGEAGERGRGAEDPGADRGL